MSDRPREPSVRQLKGTLKQDFPGPAVDALRALRRAPGSLLLMLRGVSGSVHNMCTGRAVTIRAILGMLDDIVGCTSLSIVDPARVRRGEPVQIRGSHERLTAATGWQPSIELRDILSDIVRTFRRRDGHE